MTIMADERMVFYNIDTLDDKQREAAGQLPIKTNPIVWTEEENEILSEEQKFIAEAKLNGATYKTIAAYFKITYENSVSVALRMTALGYRWEPHKSDGSIPYVSDVYIERLKKLVEERCYNLNAMKTVETMEFLVNSVKNMWMLSNTYLIGDAILWHVIFHLLRLFFQVDILRISLKELECLLKHLMY